LNDAVGGGPDIAGTFTNNSSLVGVDPLFVRNPSDGGDGWGDDPSTPGVDESANDDYGDLRLGPASPAIDAGDNTKLPPDDFDLDGDGDTAEPLPIDQLGNRRIYGLGVDIGSIEYTPVAGRYVFYNNSIFDGGDPGAGVNDDDAIALGKSPLLPGRTALFANYTSCSRGINGIMVDIYDPPGTPVSGDFGIRVNEAGDPDTWSAGPTPTVSVRPGEGVGSSDRVTLIWADGAIRNQWVKVTVLATDNTGLAEDDVFCFGNVIGDIDGNGRIDGDDYDTVLTQFGQTGGGLAADFNVDGGVDFADFAALRLRYGSSVLPPTLPAPSPEAAAALRERVEQAIRRSGDTANGLAVTPNDVCDLLAMSIGPEFIEGSLSNWLIESPGAYTPEVPLLPSGSSAQVLYHAVTAEHALRTLGDDLSNGRQLAERLGQNITAITDDLLDGWSARGGAMGNWQLAERLG